MAPREAASRRQRHKADTAEDRAEEIRHLPDTLKRYIIEHIPGAAFSMREVRLLPFVREVAGGIRTQEQRRDVTLLVGFTLFLESKRCKHMPGERDLCPGRISICPHC